jgi:hypothetical protein
MYTPKYKTQRGTLTAYALACGYCDNIFTKAGYKIELYQDAGTANYNIKVWDDNAGMRIYWECFDNLTAARKNHAAKAKEFS